MTVYSTGKLSTVRYKYSIVLIHLEHFLTRARHFIFPAILTTNVAKNIFVISIAFIRL